ncbi:ribosome assembly RNA-binding protein YhbY [Paenibacillus sp. 28ISP30-2]|jgi:RNA-binding protein|uniref:RNA-binding protein n=2 Tax=Paenibacillus terrae TaxID=159743 RepID=A0A0D7X619_9BACL|nr:MULTISPECIES: ribosome assembly RNA-binding protein YhbY [Paenibacillus]MBE0341873.1 ribosome assembly RNA-binding protein YhbY [Paenibacillus sp. 28ISP30-2]AET61866.1 dihydrodipicolinate reductase [Paenibacillus terrae HPL-003]ALP38299.1 RNA-binding protein [Paenibacillus sp. IHB B 3084]KJD46674.1 RNA-binding protein [Paenibacillus terrae]MBE0337204.1 ribosome assembly RNA-binding protein YhbY [Paenibacillus sp. 23TSA30-6]
MLTGKQKRYLRSMAHHLDPVFQVGKNGTNEHLMRHINDAIEKRELMKVQILNNCLDDKHEIAEELATETGSELVQLIGSTIILYKESRDNKQIELPRG